MILDPYFRKRHAFFLLLILTFSCFISNAQNASETRWYFGNSTENLVFDRNGRDVYLETNQTIPFGNAGAVTISDQFNGNLLFYTDGAQVFDASHTHMPSGIGLNGNASINAPVVTCPVPGNQGQYYLFVNPGTNAPNQIQYYIADANQMGNGSARFPLGDVISGPTMIGAGAGLTDPSEGMTVIPQGNGTTFWLVSQDRTNFEIRVTEINNGGVDGTANYDFTGGSNPGFEAAHFSFNEDSSWLTMSPKTANRNIWLMQFNVATGVPTFDHQLTGTGFNDGADESVYDVEWSNDGSKLYLSRFGGAGNVANLYQIDFNDSSEPVNKVFALPINRSYGLKRAIDGRIYHLYQQTSASRFEMGRINQPDSVIDSIQYQLTVFDVNFNSRQFPEFTAGHKFRFDLLDFHYIDSCFDNVTKFFPIVDPPPQSMTWDFGDGGGSNAIIANYTYQAQGGYMVSLMAEVNGIVQTVTKPVEILANDLMVDLGNDTTICVDEVLTLDAGMGTSYVWNTGELSQTIQVDTTGTYWVEVTNAAGCTDFDDIVVTEYQIRRQVSNQWYFGQQAGIDFNQGAIALVDGNDMMSSEGCATVSDVNGELLFYTNGITVWNKEHDVMVNGSDIGGDQTAAQSALILPYGNDNTLFYIFTTEEVYGDGSFALRYSIVDMKEDQARGKVVVKDQILMNNSTERVTASGFNGNDLLLAHEFGNNTFRSYATNMNGLSQAIYSPTGEIHAFTQELNATGYMKFAPDLNVVAVTLPQTNQVEIFDFSQGELSNPRLINTSESNLYGLEFSASSNRLYLTASSGSSRLIQYDLDSLNSMNPVNDIEATKFDGYPTGMNYGALQTGPDGVIYMAVDNSGTLGTITSGNANDAGNGFNPTAFNLDGRTSRLGLPNFAQNQSTPLQTPGMTVDAGCLGQTSTFSAVGRDNSIENYLWIFGDGQSAVVQDTTHVYDSPGMYRVELQLSNRCDMDTSLFMTIEIFTIPDNPMVPADIALCDAPVVLSAWNVDDPNLSYYWSTGETTRQITVSNPEIIDVAIIDNTTGCPSDTLSVFIADARPWIDLGSDQTLCQHSTRNDLDAGIPGATYAWSINGVVSGSNRTFAINTGMPGIFEYTVEITDTFGCVGRDTLAVTVFEQPVITSVGNVTTSCAFDDGSIDITFASAGSFSYQATGSTPFGPLNFDSPDLGGSINVPSLAPGSYVLTVTNIITGCTVTEVILIDDVGADMVVTSTDGCIGDGQLTLSNTPAAFSYTIQYRDGSTVAIGNTMTAFMNLDTGAYFVTIQDLGGLGCIETGTARIQLVNPQPAFTFDAIQEFCGTPGEALVTDGTGGLTTYDWTGPGSFSASGASVSVTQPGIYQLTGSGSGFCPRTESIEVIFNADPVANVIIDGDPCEGHVVLIANVTGGSGVYSYYWSDGSRGQRHTITTSGSYTVNITDQLTGCAITSAVDATVQQQFDVTLTLEPDCANNGTVFVTATTTFSDDGVAYEWRNPNGEVIADTDSVIAITQTGQYSVQATYPGGVCVATDNILATAEPIPEEVLILPGRVTFCSIDPIDPTVNLNPGVFNSYEWRLRPDAKIISTGQLLTVSTEGIYEVTIFNGFSCVTDEVVVVEDCHPIIFAPNAFSPNTNDMNEDFFVFPNEYVNGFEILIYSRWGELVYFSDTQDFRWNGIYRGSLLPVGTYAYVMKFTSMLQPELGTIEQYGSVTLIR